MSGPIHDSTWRPVVEQFFQALGDGRWLDAATLVDSSAMALFRERQLASLVGWAQQRDALRDWRKTADGGSFGWSSDGTLHSDVLASVASTRLAAVPGVDTLGALAALPAVAFLSKYLELNTSPSSNGTMGVRRVLGGVVEGDSIVHVVYRNEGPDITYSEPHYVNHLRLKRSGEEWFVDVWGDPEFASGHAVMRLADDFLSSMLEGEHLDSDV